DRIGRRVHTDRSLGVPVDLGASWIHGVRDNPVAELAEETGTPWLVANGTRTTAFDEANLALSPARVAEIEATAWQVLRRGLRGSWRRSADESVAAAVAREIDRRGVSAADLPLVMAEIRRLVEHEFAADLDGLSAWEGDEGVAIRGDEVILPDGYDRLLEPLAAVLRIDREVVLRAVRLRDDGVTLDSTAGPIEAAAVVVTLPLGVLQAGSVAFDPSLPDAHQAAIASLGMGLLDKVVLRFPARFWGTGAEWIGFVPPTGRLLEFYDLTPAAGVPLLVGFSAGTPARDQEVFDDDTVVTEAATLLRAGYA
ncbi:MAG: hypothetical protein FJW95_08860, partial [Actinobacteria bacterium]|nr:hypothetical protein [Actinomycetota bacterium]